MSKSQWYAFYVNPRHEKKAFLRIQELQVEAYIPTVKIWNQWSDRKKEVEKVLIPGYIFCRIKLEDRLSVLQTPGVVSIVKVGGKLVSIPDEQIETLKQFVRNSDTLTTETQLFKGEKVRVFKGAFAGATGVVKSIRGKTRLFLVLDNLNLAYSVKIQKSDLQRLNK